MIITERDKIFLQYLVDNGEYWAFATEQFDRPLLGMCRVGATTGRLLRAGLVKRRDFLCTHCKRTDYIYTLTAKGVVTAQEHRIFKRK